MWLWYWMCFSNVTYAPLPRDSFSPPTSHHSWARIDTKGLLPRAEMSQSVQNVWNRAQWWHLKHNDGIWSTFKLWFKREDQQRKVRRFGSYFSFRSPFVRITSSQVLQASGRHFPNCKMGHRYWGIHNEEKLWPLPSKDALDCLGHEEHTKHSSKNDLVSQ